MPSSKLFARFILCLSAIIIGLASINPTRSMAEAPTGISPNALGNSPCVWFLPLENPDHSLNVPLTITSMKKNGFGCLAMPIEDKPPYLWADFQRLVEAADKAGIDIWPVLIPPSEGGASLPYTTDYATWFKVLAKLSLHYPHLRGVNVDDMVQGISPKTFTRDYICELYRDKQAINPKFLAIPTVYDLDTALADRLAGCVDGVWMTWTNLETATGFVGFLRNSRLAVKGRFPIYAPVYAHATSWHKQGDPPPANFLRTLNKACQYSDGIVLWNLSPLDPDPLLAITRTFNAGGSSQYAGRCREALQTTPGVEKQPVTK